MATEIVMPKLGLTMESGTVSAWLVEEGKAVKKGQALLEIETDKVTMEVEAQVDGVLRKIAQNDELGGGLGDKAGEALVVLGDHVEAGVFLADAEAGVDHGGD